MTAWTADLFWPRATADDAPSARPAPLKPPAGPVFVQDCAQPFDGSTMLLALLRRDAALSDEA
jgi:hypothetical protein